jgi:hypothetical protein
MHVFQMRTLIEWDDFFYMFFLKLQLYLVAWKACFLSPLPPSTVIGILTPTISILVCGWVCYVQNNATAFSCSYQLWSQVVIGYFLAAGRLTTGTG